MNPQHPNNPFKVAALVAFAGVVTLVILTVTGILATLPKAVAVTLVVMELLVPAVVYQVLKRSSQG